MTNARKIEILESAKENIKTGENRFICTAISNSTNIKEDAEFAEQPRGTSLAVYLFGELFLKHKPNFNFEVYGNSWFNNVNEDENKKDRIEVIDKMIAELKTLEQ